MQSHLKHQNHREVNRKHNENMWKGKKSQKERFLYVNGDYKSVI